MTSYHDSPRYKPEFLSQKHEEMIFRESGVTPDVARERGVRTITRGRQLPQGFSPRQRRRGAGILFTVHRPNGETSHSFRPDEPDPESPGRKYEQPSKHYGGPGNVLDVHPSCQRLIDRSDVPVVFVEGIKKGDAILSVARAAGVEILVVVISGVWNWLSDGEPIPDMSDIPVEGREVSICFDSDILTNPNVQDAARQLAEHLIARGGEVSITFFRDKADGSKMGADDFFVAGGSFSELRLLTRPYDPADFTIVRLNRDERLRLALGDIERRFWALECKGLGGHSARDVYLKLYEAARRHGKLVEDGLRVVMAWGPLAIEAKVSSRTLSKAINRLEEWDLLYRDNEGRKRDKAGAFVLRASVKQYGEKQGRKEEATQELQGLFHRTLHLRAPRLRWSQPKYTPKRGAVPGTRRVRQGPKPEPRDRIERLGKIRGAILDVLDTAGGSATLEEIAVALHKARPRDLVRCKTKASGRNGPVIWLLQAGIVEWVCDVDTRQEVLSLTSDWLDRLEDARELGKEIETDELVRERYKTRSRGYREWLALSPEERKALKEQGVRARSDGFIGDLCPDGDPEEHQPEEKISPLATAIHVYLQANPHDACQPPGWLGTTLWAFDLYPGKVTAVEVWDAIEELGGERYRRERLRYAEEAA
jgi:Domain of unknown function (DUF3854)